MKAYKLMVICLSVAVFSCAPPIEEATLKHAKDSIPPVITLSSPADGSPYSSAVEVSGTVIDHSTESGDAGEVRGLSYEVLSTSIKGSAAVGSGGAFLFHFRTTNLSGTIYLKITAVDWNGNIGEKTVSLINAGNGIPSFAVVPGNGEVTLSWNPVPLTSRYTLYYTTNGTYPSEGYYDHKIESVTSPYTITGLTNGNAHVFLLKAVPSVPEVADNWSEPLKTIPLSGQTLAPTLTPSYRGITVTWPEIQGTDEFQVYRSTDRDRFVNFTGTIQENSFFDSSVNRDTIYYYAVKPSLAGTTLSEANAAQASYFPTEDERTLGRCDTPGTAYHIDVEGNYAYIADGDSNTLQIIDISDLKHPVTKKSLNLGVPANYVDVNNGYAYVASGYSGWRIIDVQNPDNPQVLYTYSSSGMLVREIKVVGNYAFVPSGNFGFKIFDITNKTSPIRIHNINLHGAYSVDVSGNYAYVGTNTPTLQIYDISNISATVPPTSRGSCAPAAKPLHISVSGNYAYVCVENTGINIVDISNPDTPSLVPFTDPIGTYNVFSAVARGSYLYLANGSQGFQVLNVSSPSAPTVERSYGAHNQVEGVAVAGQYSFTSDGTWGLQIYDISSQRNPEEITTGITGDVKYLSIAGAYAYINKNYDLYSVDISNPENPQIQSSYLDIDNVANGGWASGNYLYLAENINGLSIIDISDPTAAPKYSAKYDLDGNSMDVVTRGDYAFVAAYSPAMLYSFRIDNSNAPLLEASCAIAGVSSRHIRIAGNYAYICAGTSGVAIVDISNPAAPSLVTTQSVESSTAWGIDVDGNYLFVAADGENDIFIYDISNPPSPIKKVGIAGAGAANGVCAEGNYVYVAESGAVEIFHFSPPETLTLIKRIITTGATNYDVEIYGKYLYVASGDNGLKVFKLWPY